MSSKRQRLADLAADIPYAIVGGPFGSKLTSADYVEEGIPVIRGTNLNGGRYLLHDDLVYVSEQKVREDLFGNLAHRGDIVFTQRGTLGQVALIPQDAPFDAYVVSQSQMKMTVDPAKADARFIYYWFTSRETIESIVSRNSSSGVPHINLTVLRGFELPVPKPDLQRRIADILASYDDLIEINTRRISLLAEAARLLYREWFVHLRFPGHEHSALVDGLPSNWSRLPIRELADLYRGKSYSSAELVEVDGRPFVNLKCIDRNGGFRSSGLKRFRGEFKPQHGVDPGDIVVAVTDMTRDALVVARAARIPRSVGSEAIFSMDLVKLKPKPAVDRAWFYGLLRYSSFPMEVREKATGATVLHLLPKHIEAWEAPVPPPVLRNMFGEHHEALLAQIDSLELQNEKLAEARDLLLPRLMNGDLAV